VIEQTYDDPNNGVLFGGTMVFAQFLGPSTGFDETTIINSEGSSVMSFTAQYTISPNGFGGQSNLGINISDPSAVSVPGPVVGAGIPGLLGMLGFGGFGWWRRRQKIA
jgi:MYXO-CTERM domain-containing protein